MAKANALSVFGTLSRIADDAVDPDYFRIEADGRAFFGHRREFGNPEALDALVPGAKLFMGCHRLDGDAYWLHWLASDRGIMEPISAAPHFWRNAALFLAGIGFLVHGFITLIVSGFRGDRYSFFSVFAVAVGTSFALLGCSCLRSLTGYAAAHTRLKRAMRLALAKYRNGQTNAVGFVPASALPRSLPAFVPELLANFEGELDVLEGNATRITYTQSIQSHTNSGRNRPEYTVYQFECAGKRIRWPLRNPKPPRPAVDSAYIFEPPDFLAEGDRIAVAVPNRADRRRHSWLPGALKPQPGDAAVVINKSDGQIHLQPPPARAWHFSFEPKLPHAAAFWAAIIAAMMYFIYCTPFPKLSLLIFLLGAAVTGLAAGVILLVNTVRLWRVRRAGRSRLSTDLYRALPQTDGFTREPRKIGKAEIRAALADLFRPLAIFLLCAYAAMVVLSKLP